jgi:hypothetical protein
MIVAGAFAVALLAGAVYQLLVHAVPILFVDLVACVAVASGIGAIAQYSIRRLLPRRRGTALLLAATLALAALAASHLVAYELGAREIAARTGMPLSVVHERVGLRDWLTLRQRGGFALSRGANLRGPGVLALWAAEALVFLGLAGYAVDKQTRH